MIFSRVSRYESLTKLTDFLKFHLRRKFCRLKHSRFKFSTPIFVRFAQSKVLLKISCNMKYESYREDIGEILEVNLVRDPTVGQQYVVRTLVLRLWNQVFRQGRGSRVLAESFDRIDWNDNLDNIKALLYCLDDCMTTASDLREEHQQMPEREMTNQILAKSQFLGNTVNGLVQSSRFDLFPNPKLSYPIEILKEIDWCTLAHVDRYDTGLVTFLGFVEDFRYYDFAPSKIEIGLNVSH